MADIINLRRFRKAGQRAAKAAEAERNRVAFGLGPAERLAAAQERSRAESRLDRHRLSPSAAPTERSDD